MKKWWIVLVSVFVVSGIGSIVSLFVIDAEEVQATEKYDISELKNLMMDVTSMDVHLVPAEGEELTLVYKGPANKRNKEMYAVKEEKRTWTLQQLDSGPSVNLSFGLQSKGPEVEIAIPEELFASVTIKSESGDIRIESLKGKEADVDTASGDFQMVDSEFSTLHWKTESGDVSLEQNKVGSGDWKSQSGSFRFEELSGKELGLSTHSGDVIVKEPSIHGTADIKTHSGDVAWDYQGKEPKNLEVQFASHSGDGTVRLDDLVYEEKEEHRLKGMRGSGKAPALTVDTKSGDFIIR
ncbi:UNVERIFIED_CONTAM: DUF4097 family beta strand repeat-containing protein [Halobacillus marinus]